MSIRLTTEEEARLTRLAERTGRSKSFYVREAIQKHLAELEEKYWEDEMRLFASGRKQVNPGLQQLSYGMSWEYESLARAEFPTI